MISRNGAAGRQAGQRDRPQPVIGLTGPIGCGKTAVAGCLAARGGWRIDADDVAREVTGPGRPELAAIHTRFGDAVFAADGALDRTALAAVVFPDPVALAELEAIVHPAVGLLVRERLAEAAAAGAPVIVMEAIKLVEGGLAALCDEVWLVRCSPAVQRARLVGRGMEAADAERRIAAQGADLADRLAPYATRRLCTDGTLEEMENAVSAALQEALERHGR
jgi:dephospho-CoA kinase